MAVVDAGEAERFKLPGTSLEGVFKVAQGYAEFGKAVSLADVAKRTGMNPSDISRNTGFLVSLGLLEGGKSKSATETGKKLGLALTHDMDEEVEGILAEVVSNSEFLKSVLAAVRIRKGMDEASLKSHIAYSAGLSKSGTTPVGTGAVVNLLKRSGNLRLEDGKLAVASPMLRSSHDSSATSDAPTQSVAVEELERRVNSRISERIPVGSPFSVVVKINVQCDAKDLDKLGLQLRKMVDDFSRAQTDELGEG